MPRIMPIYIPATYDPTSEEFPLRGPTCRTRALTWGLYGIVGIVGIAIFFVIHAASAAPKPLDTIIGTLTPTSTGTVTPTYTPTITPIASVTPLPSQGWQGIITATDAPTPYGLIAGLFTATIGPTSTFVPIVKSRVRHYRYCNPLTWKCI